MTDWMVKGIVKCRRVMIMGGNRYSYLCCSYYISESSHTVIRCNDRVGMSSDERDDKKYWLLMGDMGKGFEIKALEKCC